MDVKKFQEFVPDCRYGEEIFRYNGLVHNFYNTKGDKQNG